MIHIKGDKTEIFNKVKTHLLLQRRQSLEDDHPETCRYRGSGGLKCAIGCLISDEEYELNIEGYTVNRLAVNCNVPMTFLRSLQKVHDFYDEKSGTWDVHIETQMARIAEDFGI